MNDLDDAPSTDCEDAPEGFRQGAAEINNVTSRNAALTNPDVLQRWV
jgi:hypothetical protein